MTLESEFENQDHSALIKEAIDNAPSYKNLSSDEKQRLQETMTVDQATRLLGTVYDQDISRTQQQLDVLQDRLVEMERALETVIQPEDSTAHYTPSERRIHKVKQLIDNLPFMGTDSAAQYEQQLLPVVRERARNSMLQGVREGAKICDQQAERLEDAILRHDLALDKHKSSIEYHGAELEIANAQAIEIAAKWEELGEQKIDYAKESSVRQAKNLHKEKQDLRQRERFYSQSKRQAISAIKGNSLRLKGGYDRRMLLQSMVNQTRDFAGMYGDIVNALEFHSGEDAMPINPSTLSGLMSTYNKARDVTLKQDEIMAQGTENIMNSVPATFAEGYEPGNALKQTTYAQEQSKREKEALDIVKRVRDLKW